MKAKLFFLVTILTVLCYSGIAYAGEEITLTTYYPAPYGEYNSLSVGDPTEGYTATNDGELLVEGNVGIGTTGPEAKLEVNNRVLIRGNDTTGISTILNFKQDDLRTDIRNGCVSMGLGSGGSWWGGRFHVAVASNIIGDASSSVGQDGITGIHAMTIDTVDGSVYFPSGNVGIGTTTPGTYDSEAVTLDVGTNLGEGYVAVDDVYLKNPKYGSAKWASRPIILTGTANIASIVHGSDEHMFFVTFPAGTFTSAPAVMIQPKWCTIAYGSPSNPEYQEEHTPAWWVTNVSTGGFTIHVKSPGTGVGYGEDGVMWIAIGN